MQYNNYLEFGLLFKDGSFSEFKEYLNKPDISKLLKNLLKVFHILLIVFL
mgnify:CR=1 FL=1